jgi:hypothetical protein
MGCLTRASLLFHTFHTVHTVRTPARRIIDMGCMHSACNLHVNGDVQLRVCGHLDVGRHKLQAFTQAWASA